LPDDGRSGSGYPYLRADTTALPHGKSAMSDLEPLKPGEADVAIERAMQQRPKAMIIRDRLQKMLENEDTARQFVGAIRNMMNKE
jgi:hypothetical protein